MKKKLRTAIIGMGGFARLHQEVLQTLDLDGTTQLMATCDLAPEKFPDLCASLEARGVRVYNNYLDLLNAHQHELDLVTVPTPIPLHALMHRECVQRGLAVYLEKPPTLDWRELKAMREVEKRAKFSTQVGFNFIRETARQNLKTRLVSGEFGKLQRVSFSGYWPRPVSYYERASWAGKLRQGDHLILDSCVGNALAHYVHNLLFWCGQDEVMSFGEVEWVEAELYRAHEIESFDTVFSRGVCGGVEIRLAVTHAGYGRAWQRESLQCERATITYTTRGGGFEILWNDGRRETGDTEEYSTGKILTENLREYAAYLSGEVSRPLTTLADSQPFVHLNDLLFVSAGQITKVPTPFLHRETNERGERFVTIENIESMLEEFVKSGHLPSQTGALWGQSGRRAVASDVVLLDKVIDDLLAPLSASV